MLQYAKRSRLSERCGQQPYGFHYRAEDEYGRKESLVKGSWEKQPAGNAIGPHDLDDRRNEVQNKSYSTA